MTPTRGHVSLDQLKVMSAIERCRTAALGGHVLRCENDACGYTAVAYNSRNRHCPKCQGAAAREWMAARAVELLPVPYFHVVFTLPSAIGDIAYHNKAVIYDLLLRVSAETMLTIAADPRHLGARIAITSVLHTWGSAMTHHPHVHRIVPGGGIALDGSRWIAKRPDFFLPVRVSKPPFRHYAARELVKAHAARQLTFNGAHAALGPPRHLPPIWRRSGAGAGSATPSARSRAESRARLSVALHPSGGDLEPAPDRGRGQDSDVQGQGLPDRWTRPLQDDDARAREFIRRFLIHVLPTGFHRIRHYGLPASGVKADNLALARKLLNLSAPAPSPRRPCPIRLRPISRARAAARPCASSRRSRPANSRHRPTAMRAAIRIDTS